LGSKIIGVRSTLIFLLKVLFESQKINVDLTPIIGKGFSNLLAYKAKNTKGDPS
jgi:hypothetical protein